MEKGAIMKKDACFVWSIGLLALFSCGYVPRPPEEEIRFLAGDYLLVNKGALYCYDPEYRLTITKDFAYRLTYKTKEGEAKTKEGGFILEQTDRIPFYGIIDDDYADPNVLSLYKFQKDEFIEDASIDGFRVGGCFYHYKSTEDSPEHLQIYLYGYGWSAVDENGNLTANVPPFLWAPST